MNWVDLLYDDRWFSRSFLAAIKTLVLVISVFEALIKRKCKLTFKEHPSSFWSALDQYMGDQPQRDDNYTASFDLISKWPLNHKGRWDEFRQNLYGLRETLWKDNILLCFNGPISCSLIEEIGNALKKIIWNLNSCPLASVWTCLLAYIELTQNIRQLRDVHRNCPVRIRHRGSVSPFGMLIVLRRGNCFRASDGRKLVEAYWIILQHG